MNERRLGGLSIREWGQPEEPSILFWPGLYDERISRVGLVYSPRGSWVPRVLSNKYPMSIGKLLVTKIVTGTPNRSDLASTMCGFSLLVSDATGRGASVQYRRQLDDRSLSSQRAWRVARIDGLARLKQEKSALDVCAWLMMAAAGYHERVTLMQYDVAFVHPDGQYTRQH